MAKWNIAMENIFKKRRIKVEINEAEHFYGNALWKIATDCKF